MKNSEVKLTKIVSSRITRKQKQTIEEKANELKVTKSEFLRDFFYKHL